MEAGGVMLRVDPRVTPSMAKTPTLAQWELDRLRAIDLIFAQNRLPIIEVMSVVTVSSAKIGHSDFAKGNRHHERRTEYH
jgi:hypothetical protein